MREYYLYEKLEALKEFGQLKEFPSIINEGLAEHILLRDYQEEAFKFFITNFENESLSKNKQVHNLFHMATGSGKTVIMAGLILYLYTKGYNKFMFFVNQTNILEKTKENFINPLSSKYLFNKELNYQGKKIKINMVDNFSNNIKDENIELCFLTTQKLHYDLTFPKENSITYQDFEDDKIVFISDESHHVNSLTKSINKSQEEEKNSWEYSVLKALYSNKDHIMLEFTATADLKDNNVRNKYLDKIIYDYPLYKFRISGYTKDFQNFATDSNLWDRALIAIILSEYRKFLFSEYMLNVKPVIMMKSQRIADSQRFYNEFFNNLEKLTVDEIKKLYVTDVEVLIKALDFFKEKDASFQLLKNSLQNSFTKEKSIIMNGESDSNIEKQLLVNSLEDKNNPVRIIFTVDMLNEGWDVLNLFDIVRLYDTRQGGAAGKIGSYTIKEAQLIGRGARYCPFKINEEQEKFKRKYDFDITNDNRILETMFFHSKNDSKYISELKQALIATGLQDEEPIKREYKVRDEFKETKFYQKGFLYANKKVLKERSSVKSLEETIKNKTYRSTQQSVRGGVIDLFGEEKVKFSSYKTNIYKFKKIDYNILLGASEKFKELKFSVLLKKYPNLKTLNEFLTSEDYLGNSIIEIKHYDDLKGLDIYEACINAFEKISDYIISIKPEYRGTKTFDPLPVKSIIKDKTIYLSEIDSHEGRGTSQIYSTSSEYQVNLLDNDWYAYNDNYGTSEEKLFVKFIENEISPRLKAKKLKFYLIRNERVPELAIYNFENGERFEPDYILVVIKENIDKNIIHQLFTEPKGEHLLEHDKWKEEFLLKIKDESNTSQILSFVDNYRILGLPFFNNKYKKKEFLEYFEKWLESI